jgi:hypothetical protein
MSVLLTAVALGFAVLTLPVSVHAEEPAERPVCVEPVVDENGQGDAEIDRALRAAAPLILTMPRDWRFVHEAVQCDGETRVRFRGHRLPEVHYAVEVTLPGQPTASLEVESHATMGAFAVAEALCVNALLLLGQPIRPSPPTERLFRLWVGPTATLGAQVAVMGTELGLQWQPTDSLWLAASVGFETFGHGSTSVGKYQFSVVDASVLGGWRWQPWRRVGVAAGVGLRERTWFSHLQTTALHEDFDFSLALESELRVSVRLARSVRLGVAARPSYALEDIVVAAAGESELLRLPHFLMQCAVEVGIDL